MLRLLCCRIPGILGFGIEPACRAAFNETDPADIIEDGVAYAAELIMESGRDDWWYLVVGGQTSLRRLITEFPEAASKIDTLIVMAGNWCADFEPYPDVMAPTDETVCLHISQYAYRQHALCFSELGM